MEKCCKNHKETQYSIKIVYVVGKPCNIYRLRGNSIVRIVFSPQSVNITGLLESFGEPPKAAVWQIPAISWRTSKDKKTQICLWFVQTIGILRWHCLCFNHFGTIELLAMQVCNPPEICKAHSQHPPHSMIPLEKTFSLTLLCTNLHFRNCWGSSLPGFPKGK